MGTVSLEGVQKLLHLDVPYPHFQTYEEVLKFEMDGVVVKMVATHAWRRITIHIIEPISILAWCYEPPLFCLEFSMLQRQASLAKNGISGRDDFIRIAKNAYLRHLAYLRLKPKIDSAQEEFLNEYRDALESLKLESSNVETRVALKKSELRKKLKSDQIGQKEFQIALKRLAKVAWDAKLPYSALKREVDHALEEIKYLMINQILPEEFKKS